MAKHEKSVFYRLRLIFFGHFKSFWKILFCSKLKVLQIAEILSTIGASYDKSSLLWLLAKFWWKFFFLRNFRFFKNNSIFQKFQKKSFHQNFARSHRSEILSYDAPMVLKSSASCGSNAVSRSEIRHRLVPVALRKVCLLKVPFWCNTQ